MLASKIRRKNMDAISYLRSKHAEFRKTLENISETEEIEQKKRIFDTFCKDLTKHEEIEETIFYPFLRKYSELKEIIDHLIDEEQNAKQAMKKFNETSFDFMWKLRFAKFKYDVDHHATEEEEELFPKVEKLLSQQDLDALGTQMSNRESELL
jgi:hemerythrin superfamily protein